MRGRGKKREKSAKRVLFRHKFFRSRPFDFWEGWGVWVIWFGYEFFFSNLWRFNFFFYLLIYNGVRIFPVLYAMNFSPAGWFFSWNHRSPYPRLKSQLCRSSPKLERGRLCLYFVLSSFLHMLQLAGRLLGKKKIIALRGFFFPARYVRISSNTVFLHFHGPLGEIFPSLLCACVSSIVLFCQTVTFCHNQTGNQTQCTLTLALYLEVFHI